MDVLGDFRLGRELGRGGIGVVYEARQLSLGRRVAVKVLAPSSRLDHRQRRRFAIEAQAAAALQHPNIVPVIAYGDEGGVPYLAMRLIEGRNLAEVVRDLREGAGRGLAPRQAAELARQAADAVDYAHRHDVLHRDLKPSNFLIDADHRLWVADFGLARVQGDSDLTATGDVIGTLRYLSPEQARGRRGAVDARSDVYALGATLYEMLALRPVIEGDDRAELLIRIASEEPRFSRNSTGRSRSTCGRSRSRRSRRNRPIGTRRPASWPSTWRCSWPIGRSAPGRQRSGRVRRDGPVGGGRPWPPLA